MLNFWFIEQLLTQDTDIDFALFYKDGNPVMMLSGSGSSEEISSLDTNAYNFGYISYDYKNKIENLYSNNYSGINNHEYFFARADLVLQYTENKWQKIYDNKRIKINISERINKNKSTDTQKIKVKQRIKKSEYLASVKKLQEHILRGDVYEINYCLEFFAENTDINPLIIFNKLLSLTNAPHSVLLKHKDIYVMCASPERYLQKCRQKLISQPIKGTAPRGINKNADEKLMRELYHSEKERSENVMIVDLVRNDLSRIAKCESVKVDELFGIYSFKTVHQMISTISCELKENITFKDIIHATFPMGSMTGAPKIKAMELIEIYEQSKRGIYSGSIGYTLPNGDFDFNVVIRSIIYDKKNKYLSLPVGSAITTYADPEKEYRECLLKAQAMIRALE
jgi:para-aminobenzoate synthetase component 1